MHLDEIGVSGIVKVRDKLLTYSNPLRLESGEPSFDTPERIKASANKAMIDNQTHYVNSQGINPLRTAIIEKLKLENNINCNEKDVLITNGGMHALFTIMNTIIKEEDEIIIPTPNWTCVEWLIKMTGAKVKYVHLKQDNDFRIDIDELKSLITKKTKAILINSPHNPTGGILTEADLKEIGEIAIKNKTYLISDEAYEHIIYDDHKHTSIASLFNNREEFDKYLISVFTFSKSYAMTGWRLGYIVSKNEALMSNLKKVVLYSANGINSITQWAGITALKEAKEFHASIVKEFKMRRDLLIDAINQSKYLEMTYTPKGAFYCFAKIKESWKGINGDISDDTFAHYLIENYQLGCTPGSIFGPGGKGFIRFSYACSTDMILKASEIIKNKL